MALAPGSRFGAYEILDFVGKGGMGEVYRARDESLGREVALKVLPEALAADAERLERFHREARSLASLNHPGIAAIHGLEEADGQPFLVLELVPGEDLAERIARGAIPVDESLAIARQMAEALEEAHARGLVHRDLKPANVKLTPEGRVKLLDFGLAKVLGGDADAAGARDESRSPTLTARATAAGMILGTAAYMSPEQAKGRDVDARADVWAFACVLYEMLCGRRAFEGDGVSDTLAAVLRSDVDLDALPRDVPGVVRPLLAACLQRDPALRVRHVGDVRLALDGAFSPDVGAAGDAPPGRRRLSTGLLGAAVGAAAAALLLVALPFPRDTAGPPPARVVFSEPPPAGLEFVRAPLPSPDGDALAMLVRDDRGETAIWVRALDDVEPRRLDGTEGAVELFWSPDGRDLAFATPRELLRIDRQGGAARLVAPLTVHPLGGGVWTDDGELVVSVPGTGLVQVPATGGAPRTLLGSGGAQFLSIGRFGPGRIVYRQFGEAAGIYARSLAGGEPTALVPGGRLPSSESHVRFLPPDLLLYRGDGGRLVAQPIDADRPSVVGDPVTVAEAVHLDGGFEVGASGMVSLLVGRVVHQLTWFDRQGKPLGTIGPPGQYEEVHVSADGRTLLFVRVDPSTGNRDLWLQGLSGEAPVRFTFDASTDHLACLSPDATRVAWESHRGGTLAFYQRPIDGNAPASLILESGRAGGTLDWSLDGRFVLYWSSDGATGENLWTVSADGDGEPVPVVEGPFDEQDGRFSPDGRFLAYRSNETGEHELYVQKLDGVRATGQKRRISTGGGMGPRWRADGEELFFLSGKTLMACPMRLEGDALHPGTPVPLFELALQSTRYEVPFAAMPDGERFLVVVSAAEGRALPATVKLNWRPEGER